MNRLCGGVGGRAGLGGCGGCEEELKTVVYFVVAVCVKVEKIWGMAACGEAGGVADSRRMRQTVAEPLICRRRHPIGYKSSSARLEAVPKPSFRVSTIDALAGSRSRTLRGLRLLVPWRSHVDTRAQKRGRRSGFFREKFP